jgi:hypothetical protein
MMPIIIQGPKQPGKDINLYLRPLVEDLKMLREDKGVPYWEVLEVRSAIDVMHVMKNFCMNLLGHLGVYGKRKHTIEARQKTYN